MTEQNKGKISSQCDVNSQRGSIFTKKRKALVVDNIARRNEFIKSRKNIKDGKYEVCTKKSLKMKIRLLKSSNVE